MTNNSNNNSDISSSSNSSNSSSSSSNNNIMATSAGTATSTATATVTAMPVTSTIGPRKIVKIVSSEGDEYDLEECVIEMCRTVKYIASGKVGFRNGLGGWFNIEGKYVLHKKEGRLLATIYSNTDLECILCFPEIRGQILATIIDYCKFHSASPTPAQITEHDEALISMKQSNLCELASASYYLDVKSLVSLTSREIAAQISQKSSEEIRETFTNLHLAGYNQYFSSKCSHKKTIKKDKILQIQNTPAVDDNRTVDELLEFLGEDSKKKKSNSKNNKKSKQQQQQTKQQQSNKNNNKNNTTSSSPPSLPNQTSSPTLKSQNGNNNNNTSSSSSPSTSSNSNINVNNNPLIKQSKSSPDLYTTSLEHQKRNNNSNNNKLYNNNNAKIYEIEDDDVLEDDDDDDSDDDDQLDPDLQEEIDKEVENFKQRLDLFSRQSKQQKLTLPSRTLAALLDVY
ncbi:hypothetical protein SAMD00019534_106460 [Acytostelium subglobosum LB1]|uniref:hypothetical protein n=1 Tax=Acytostelium subglobosum LB1 TaxID=1410327 RepID=UPI0006449BBA|nr:hypothetical protein SAMD00019534_106460 [Acytostelium subglobosum LB1]GAM27470.1 hypothetical protein SAMD00019534_106460 [Acytostelium subglobosum LB1]|eukprot:XP_012749535.1 hypothetical protein SAMD00019534_106460 [Acytostelium subglobosum LB1]